jgi:hypothetical protein
MKQIEVTEEQFSSAELYQSMTIDEVTGIVLSKKFDQGTYYVILQIEA